MYSRPASLVFFHAAPMSWLAACRRKSGAFSLSPLSLGTSLTLTLSVRVRSVPVKPSLSAVKVPMLAIVKSPFGGTRFAPIASLL